MPKPKTASIDVTKIDKSKLYPGKNGAKYLDLLFFGSEDRLDNGTTHMVVQGLSKEDRDAGGRGEILGNAKLGEAAPAGNVDQTYGDDDVPF